MRKSKYRSVRTQVDGIWFDSKREALRYGELKVLAQAGIISELKLQPSWPLQCGGNPVRIKSDGYPNGRSSVYRADFSYVDKQEGLVVEDVKGMDTPVSRLKRAMVEAEYGVSVRIVR